MADIQKLAAHVAAHPDDHDRRWRLAKALYMDCEYADALEHLRVLKDNWVSRINVTRYLAATHYRLGQYDEAIAVLCEALELWPREIPVREQLARVYEVAGERDEAARVWESILDLDRHHLLAAQSIKRLRTAPRETPEEELRIVESDSGIDLSDRRVCPNCGAQNDAEFDRCWQCHGLLPRPGVPTPTPRPAPQTPQPSGPWAWTLVCGFLIVTFISLGMYLALRHVSAVAAIEQERMVFLTVSQAVNDGVFMTRVIITAILLVAWPAALWLGVIAARGQRPPGALVNGAGVLLATMTHVVSWAPLPYLPYTPLVPAIASLVLITATFKLGFVRSLVVWTVQACCVIPLIPATAGALEGTVFLRDLPQTVRYAAVHDAHRPGARSLAPAPAPATFTLRWESTGSPWLDDKVGEVAFEISGDASQPPFAVELWQDDQLLVKESVTHVPHRATCRVNPALDYELVVPGPPDTFVTLNLFGVLPFDSG
jgi:hypothetical protein